MELLKIWRHGVSGELYRKKAIEYALDEENKGSNEDMVQDQNGNQKKNKKYIRIFTPRW